MIKMNLTSVAFVVVLACWLGFLLTFLLRKKPPVTSERKRDSSSIFGVVLQGLSFLIVWAVRRPIFTSFGPSNKAISVILEIIAVVSAIASIALVIAAVRILGKEWSLTARVVTGHKLATKGPYNFVRHPIYTAMLGMLLANGIVSSYWPALFVAIAVYLGGTLIRIRSEERLLLETFGAEFEAYTKRVPALLPGLY